jgi:hypothetical protein
MLGNMGRDGLCHLQPLHNPIAITTPLSVMHASPGSS